MAQQLVARLAPFAAAAALVGLAAVAWASRPANRAAAVATGLLSDECWHTYFADFDLLNVSCLLALVSKALSLAVIGGAFFVKLPQLHKILVERLFPELRATYLEALASALTVTWFAAKGEPLHTYGESVVLAVVNSLVVLAIWRMQFPGAAHAAAVAVCAAAVMALAVTAAARGVSLAPLGLPAAAASREESLVALQYTFNGIFYVSRASQIADIVARGRPAAEGLALISLLLQFAGTGARVFTTARDVKDVKQLAFSAISLACNAIVFAQYLVLVVFAAPPRAAAAAAAPKAAAPKAAAPKAAAPKEEAASASPRADGVHKRATAGRK